VFTKTNATTDSFLKKFGDLMGATPAGTMLTADLCASYRNGVEQFAKASGVSRVAEGRASTGKAEASAEVFVTNGDTFLKSHELMNEVFGPSTLVIQCTSREQMLEAARALEGQLTATIHGTPQDLSDNRELISILETKAGRLVFNGFPTGVEVCHAMTHGGPYPATADGRSTSVGTRAIERFVRPVCYQNFPEASLPDELKDSNPLNLWRLVDGEIKR
jgi:NADP-dependent aldehyde dehydrogenase